MAERRQIGLPNRRLLSCSITVAAPPQAAIRGPRRQFPLAGAASSRIPAVFIEQNGNMLAVPAPLCEN
jgi:hypothetical protein